MGRLLQTKIFFICLFVSTAVFAEIQTTLSNTNFSISKGSIFPNDKKRYLYNYDRLRLRIDYTKENFFLSMIGDGINYFGKEYVNSPSFSYVKIFKSDTPYATQTPFYEYKNGNLFAKLYRLYGGYEDASNRIIVGLQNIRMGVGRIWNPTNLFNSRNTYALEPNKIFGVSAISYTRHINDLSDITMVVSQKKDLTYKYALRYKAFLAYADFALNMVSSKETKMLGYEIEANLAQTGIEVRSEGAWIKNKVEFFQGIVGADYYFENGITLVGEALYSSKTFDYETIFQNINSEILPNLHFSNYYVGGTVRYSFLLFLDASFGYIESFNTKNSRFITPALTYTLNDFHKISIGAMIQNGSSESEFGMFANTYYFKYSLEY